MRPAGVAGVASALAAALLLAPALPTGGTGTAAAAECTWQRQAKRVVKRVKREGRPRRVVRVKRWWSCRPAAVQPVPMPASVPVPEHQPAPDPEPEPETGPARLSVKAQEFSFTLSRPNLPAGEAIVELNNQGEDPHDLNLQQEGSEEPPLAVPEAGPLEHRTAKFDLPAGTYRLWCSLPQHDEWGMNATLTVTGPG
ncbi:MAG TPA: plastocyanin/azurin family copper-binding protein [Solirubrobacterales bacterium]|nr:plastocyanin/azurin family copper-binding protein [Solirubrobacterales bacterium]